VGQGSLAKQIVIIIKNCSLKGSLGNPKMFFLWQHCKNQSVYALNITAKMFRLSLLKLYLLFCFLQFYYLYYFCSYTLICTYIWSLASVHFAQCFIYSLSLSFSVCVCTHRYVVIAMEALDQLLMACHSQSIKPFVESFLHMVAKLLESREPDLQVLGTNSVSLCV